MHIPHTQLYTCTHRYAQNTIHAGAHTHHYTLMDMHMPTHPLRVWLACGRKHTRRAGTGVQAAAMQMEGQVAQGRGRTRTQGSEPWVILT